MHWLRGAAADRSRLPFWGSCNSPKIDMDVLDLPRGVNPWALGRSATAAYPDPGLHAIPLPGTPEFRLLWYELAPFNPDSSFCLID